MKLESMKFETLQRQVKKISATPRLDSTNNYMHSFDLWTFSEF